MKKKNQQNYKKTGTTKNMRSTMDCIFWVTVLAEDGSNFEQVSLRGPLQLTGGITGRDAPFNIHKNAVYSIHRIHRSAQGVLFN